MELTETNLLKVKSQYFQEMEQHLDSEHNLELIADSLFSIVQANPPRQSAE